MSEPNPLNDYSTGEGQEPENRVVIAPANSEAAIGALSARGDGANPIDRANKPVLLDDLVGEIAARDAGLRRDLFAASRLQVEGHRLIAGDQEFNLGREGMRRLCQTLRAPADYISSRSPGLQQQILQEHLAEGRYADRKLTDRTSCVLSRDGVFLGLGRSDLCTLGNAEVLQALRDGVGADTTTLEVQNLKVDGESFSLDVVSPRIAEEVRMGDVVRGGVHVTHSPLHGQATQVMAYAVRLLCTNGLVQRECLGGKRRSTPRTRRLPASRAEARELQAAQIRKLVADTWGGLQEKLAAIRGLQDKQLEVRATLERFLRQAHLFSHGLMGRLLRAWEEEGSENSAFGALNALTRVATHARELPSWQRQRLARLAGVYANQDVHLCPHCFSILAAQ